MPATDRMPLAMIDLSSPDTAELAKKVREACIDTGFFYVINHGIKQELIDEVFSEGKKFFDLPLEKKLEVIQTENFRGYTPRGSETLDPANSKEADTNEAFYIGWQFSQDDPRPLHGPNIWPAEDLLPGWRATMESYYTEILPLGLRVASLIALALHMDKGFFEDKFKTPMTQFRILHYNGVVSSPKQGVFGGGAHSDYGLLTLLATDDNSGLQICKDRGAASMVWEDIPPVRGAFIVNLGDMLERWTNGLFRSTLHRVLLSGVDRYSVPFFFDPDYETLVECLPTCQSPLNPPKFPPIISGEHQVAKYAETYAQHSDLLNRKKV